MVKIFTDEEALEIAKIYSKPPKWIEEAREYNTLLNQLVQRGNHKELLSQIEHIEKSEDKFKARKKYSRSITDLNERLLRPIDNVFSATGGSKTFDGIKVESQRSHAMSLIKHSRGHKPLSKFMSTIWKESYITDPMSVTFMEISKDGEKTYPTYKSIQCINYYECEGQYISFIVFDLGQHEDGKKLRIVDGQTDRTIFIKGELAQIIQDETFPHIFGRCPAIINSDIEMIGKPYYKLSILDKVIEIQKEYLRDQSILTLVKFLNGFQNLVRPRIICSSCHGVKKINDQDCSTCNGTGWMVNRDVTDEIVLPIDLNNPEQQIPNATTVASYIGLDTATWDQYRSELKVLEVLIYEALWGTHMTNQENQTATAKFIDTQPVINRLNLISDNAEHIESFIWEMIANHVIPTKKKDESVASVNYGRRFIIDPPDALLEAYYIAKEKGVSVVILDRMFKEYLTSKHKGDEETLRMMLIKSKIEPYLHYSIKEVYDTFGANEAQKKMVFTDFWESLSYDDMYKKSDQLELEFENFVKLKLNKNESSEEVPL